MSNVLNKLKALDAYPKVNEDFFTRTLSGGVITLVSSIFMLCLFLSELNLYLRVQTVNELSVDTSRGEQLQLNVDITFPALPCGWLSMDVMDISGDMHLDADHDIYKRRLDTNGNQIQEPEKHHVGPHEDDAMGPGSTNGTYCGSCYGAAPGDRCCNTCDDVRDAYRKKGWAFSNVDTIEQCKREGYLEKLQDQKGEGCHLWGSVLVNKVAGNFHFAPGKSFQQSGMHVHDLLPFGTTHFDLSHHIHKLSFGYEYPGMHNPLDDVKVSQKSPSNPEGATGMFQYFLKVVPTIYSDRNNKTISSNQFSVTEHFRGYHPGQGQNLPGVFFFYDLSPIKVQLTENKSSFLHFVTSVCAIVGGVFTVSGLVDAFVYHGHQVLRKKMELGKLT